MGKFVYKNVKVSVYKEAAGTYNVETEYNNTELLSEDNIFKANNMKDAEELVKSAIDKELGNDNNLMDSYPENDEITRIIQDIVGDEYTVKVKYHQRGDGKHVILLNNKEELSVNAWDTKTALRKRVQKFIDG